MNVLLVEDDERIIEFVLRGLHAEGYHVDVARNGRDALRRALAPACQLIILDLLLPDLDGREVCRQLRAASVATPILMLTALDTPGRPGARPAHRRRRLPGQAVRVRGAGRARAGAGAARPRLSRRADAS